MCLLGSRPNVSFLYHQLLHRQSSFPCLLSVLFGLMDFDLFQPNLRSGPGTHKTPPSWLRVLSGKSGASFLSSSLHRSSMCNECQSIASGTGHVPCFCHFRISDRGRISDIEYVQHFLLPPFIPGSYSLQHRQLWNPVQVL